PNTHAFEKSQRDNPGKKQTPTSIVRIIVTYQRKPSQPSPTTKWQETSRTGIKLIRRLYDTLLSSQGSNTPTPHQNNRPSQPEGQPDQTYRSDSHPVKPGQTHPLTTSLLAQNTALRARPDDGAPVTRPPQTRRTGLPTVSPAA